LLIIVELLEDPLEPINFDLGTRISHSGFYALVHRATAPIAEKTPVPVGDTDATNHGYWAGWQFGSLAEPNQNIVHCLQKTTVVSDQVGPGPARKRLAILAVNIKSIRGPLIGIRDPAEDRGNLDQLYYFLIGRDVWGKGFHDMAVLDGAPEGGTFPQSTSSPVGRGFRKAQQDGYGEEESLGSTAENEEEQGEQEYSEEDSEDQHIGEEEY
jgi:hypothetical protein